MRTFYFIGVLMLACASQSKNAQTAKGDDCEKGWTEKNYALCKERYGHLRAKANLAEIFLTNSKKGFRDGASGDLKAAGEPPKPQAAMVPESATKSTSCPKEPVPVWGEDVRTKKGFRVHGQVEELQDIKEPKSEPLRALQVTDDCFMYYCEIDSECKRAGGSYQDCFIPTRCSVAVFN